MVTDKEYLELLDKKTELQRKIIKLQTELSNLRAILYEKKKLMIEEAINEELDGNDDR